MIQDLWKVVGISGAAQIVPEKGELGVILPITIAMKLRVTVLEILKVGSGVKQRQFLLQQVSPLKMKELILATIKRVENSQFLIKLWSFQPLSASK